MLRRTVTDHFQCDRCSKTIEVPVENPNYWPIEDLDPTPIPDDWTVLQLRHGGVIELCPGCAAEFGEWLNGYEVKESKS